MSRRARYSEGQANASAHKEIYMTRWTEDDLARFERNSGHAIAPAAKQEIQKALVKRQGGSKFNSVRTTRGALTFDSKLEARRYDELVLLEDADQLLFFLCQTPWQLPGGVVYRSDFMVFYPAEGGSVRFEVEDCKGLDTPVSVLKRKQVEDLYGIKINLVKKAGGK